MGVSACYHQQRQIRRGVGAVRKQKIKGSDESKEGAENHQSGGEEKGSIEEVVGVRMDDKDIIN